MVFWNYCPNCGKRLTLKDVQCSNCGINIVCHEFNEDYIFTIPISDIGFFSNLKIDFSPYINTKANDFEYDVCSCGYINKIDNEFCYNCGVRRIKKGFSRFISKKPKFDINRISKEITITCKCGAINDMDSEFCEMCGASLKGDLEKSVYYNNFDLEFENPIFCFCGEENDIESQFCRNCGLPLDYYENINDFKILCTCSLLNELNSDFCIECGKSLNEEFSEIICSCGTRNSFDSKFCKSCDSPLNPDKLIKTKIICSCGKILDFNAEFCSNCGKNIKRIVKNKKFFSNTFRSVKNFLR